MSGNKAPNILICGTPGSGKSTLCERLVEETNLRLINVNELAKRENLYSGYDEEFQAHYLDEDKVVDHMEDQMDEGGNIVEYHGCDFFPERWFNLVVVLSVDTKVLYERLEQRGYSKKKIEENVCSEIMQVIATEAAEGYSEETVDSLPSNSISELEENVEKITRYIKKFMSDNKSES